MATRWYKPPSSAATGISPTPDSLWDNTGSVARVIPSLTKTSTAFATQQIVDATGTSDRDVVFKQFVFPLSAGTVFTTSDTFKGRTLAFEGNLNQNLRSQCVIRVIASDGTTVRATLYAGDATTLTGNPTSEWNTSQRNIQMPRGSTVTCAANYTTVSGDYLVWEEGFRKHAANSSTGNLRYGDNSGTDLAENETTTADNDTWFEWSGDIAAPATDATGDIFIPTDTFTGSSGTALETYDSNWSTINGANQFVISNANRARPNSFSDCRYNNLHAPTSAQYDVRADGVFLLSSAGAECGVLGRSADFNNGYRLAYDGTLWRLLLISGGSGTVLGFWTESMPVSTTRTIDLRLRTASKQGVINGILRMISPNNTISAANFAGIYAWNDAGSNTTGIHLDNFQAQDVTLTATGVRRRAII